jgi:hypothetical protein
MLELNQLRIEQMRETEARDEQVKELLQELECLLKAVAWVSTEIDGSDAVRNPTRCRREIVG